MSHFINGYSETRPLETTMAAQIRINKRNVHAINIKYDGDLAAEWYTDRKTAIVKVFGNRFLKKYVPLHCKLRTAYEYCQSMEVFIEPKIGGRKALEIRLADNLTDRQRRIALEAVSRRTFGTGDSGDGRGKRVISLCLASTGVS